MPCSDNFAADRFHQSCSKFYNGNYTEEDLSRFSDFYHDPKSFAAELSKSKGLLIEVELLRNRNNYLSSLLCEILEKEIGLSDLNVDYSEEVNKWWANHKKQDNLEKEKNNYEKELTDLYQKQKDINDEIYKKAQELEKIKNDMKTL